MRRPIAILVCALLTGSSGCATLHHDSSKRVATPLEELTVSEAAKKIRVGELTSEQLVRALVTKAQEHGNLNAFITLAVDEAMAAAKEADAKTADGAALGPLHGVPLVVKDNIHVAGLPNTAGTPALEGFVPEVSAPVVQSLLDAGAIILGKTNMHELAFGVTSDNARFGSVNNPYQLGYLPGGSSGGTGAAVAARLAPAGLGTDTGGSVRIPASLNGIVGLRPTLGRYSQVGITPIAHTRDTAGPMARTVEDLVLLDGVITGAPTTQQPADLAGLRLGVPRGYFYENLDPETARLTEHALAILKGRGVELVEADIPGIAELNGKVGFPVALYEVVEDLSEYLERYQTGLSLQALAVATASSDVHGLFATLTADKNRDGEPDGMIPTPVYREAIQVHRPALQRAYTRYFVQQRVDAIIFPTTPLPARPIEGSLAGVELNGETVPTFDTYIHNTDPGSDAGLPGVTIPIGLTKTGLPVGLEADGPVGSDRRLLSIALAMEAAFGTLPPP